MVAWQWVDGCLAAGLVWGGAGLAKQPGNVFVVLNSARA